SRAWHAPTVAIAGGAADWLWELRAAGGFLLKRCPVGRAAPHAPPASTVAVSVLEAVGEDRIAGRHAGHRDAAGELRGVAAAAGGGDGDGVADGDLGFRQPDRERRGAVEVGADQADLAARAVGFVLDGEEGGGDRRHSLAMAVGIAAVAAER